MHAVWQSYLSYEASNWEAVLATADMPDADVRHALLAIEPFYDELPRARQLELCKALSERPTANPWLTHYFSGKYEIHAAWDARGSGWAHTVTDENSISTVLWLYSCARIEKAKCNPSSSTAHPAARSPSRSRAMRQVKKAVPAKQRAASR